MRSVDKTTTLKSLGQEDLEEEDSGDWNHLGKWENMNAMCTNHCF